MGHGLVRRGTIEHSQNLSGKTCLGNLSPFYPFELEE